LAKHKLFFCLTLFSYLIAGFPLIADAIPPEESAAYLPRAWTPPGELTPEEQAQLVLDVIKDAIRTDTTSTSNGSNSVTADVVSPSIVQKPAILLPVTPTNQESVTQTVTTVKALEQAGPAPTTVAYQAKYKELQALWKATVNGKSMASGYGVFFEQDDLPTESTTVQKSSDDPYGTNTPESIDDVHESVEALSSGNITSKAIQALMFRYLGDNPKNDIPVDNISAASAFISEAPENAVRINEGLLKSAIFDPALDAFTKKYRSMYASIVRLEGSGKGQYVVVTIDKQGNVALIDSALAKKGYDKKLLTEIVTSLNNQRKATDLKFVAAKTDSILYTGLNGKDSDNTRSGLYAFAYWAAFMSVDKLDAYQRVNGAATEETTVLDSYDSINLSALYSKKLKQIPAIKDSNAYELDLREWLRSQVKVD
ncbi:MAG: hypothetical protein Q8R43_01450, partial [Alphaproteobacteria bacterium]|nr:hypothetical protein [Alphaproteobacteria bacterium]